MRDYRRVKLDRYRDFAQESATEVIHGPPSFRDEVTRSNLIVQDNPHFVSTKTNMDDNYKPTDHEGYLDHHYATNPQRSEVVFYGKQVGRPTTDPYAIRDDSRQHLNRINRRLPNQPYIRPPVYARQSDLRMVQATPNAIMMAERNMPVFTMKGRLP